MPTLLERKLMPMGKGGIVVSIPAGWAKYYKLSPGDRVEVIANGDLIIRPKVKKEVTRDS